jgi:NAD(P)-dependent dehydrogenase (short-subunit alcohol dehydrogenase family)
MKEPIDLLVHNSGVYYTKRTFSTDGIEIVFQVNHLSSFCLNWLLKDRIKAEGHARIIFVNSEGHRFALGGVHLDDLQWRWHPYTGLKSYGAAKTAQLLTMAKFAEFYSGSGVTINAMHPGNVRSRIGENNGPCTGAGRRPSSSPALAIRPFPPPPSSTWRHRLRWRALPESSST